MNLTTLALLAGGVSSSLFIVSYIPMLARAFHTRDLRSYSPTQLMLSNLANAIHWLYVLHLPPGPIWLLHGFYTLATAAMLFWYVRYRRGWAATPPAAPKRQPRLRARSHQARAAAPALQLSRRHANRSTEQLQAQS
jgi:hypothetical protein